MLRGFATVSYFADDLEAAKNWYSELLGVEPYYHVEDAYWEFRIGDYQHELGIVNSKYAVTPPGASGEIIYWHVDDVEAALERLLSMGARLHDSPKDRGEGFITATAVDPFGNIVGVMYNPHYVDVLNKA